MDRHDRIVDLAAIAVPLPRDADGFLSALCRSRFVDETDRFVMRIIASDQLLASVSQHLLVPFDRFEESLQGSRRLVEA